MSEQEPTRITAFHKQQAERIQAAVVEERKAIVKLVEKINLYMFKTVSDMRRAIIETIRDRGEAKP